MGNIQGKLWKRPSDSCSICFDAVMENGVRSFAKLQCGHQFHLDCIGSAFNTKGAMECPNCRKIQKGEWRYANNEFSSYLSTELITHHSIPVLPNLQRDSHNHLTTPAFRRIRSASDINNSSTHEFSMAHEEDTIDFSHPEPQSEVPMIREFVPHAHSFDEEESPSTSHNDNARQHNIIYQRPDSPDLSPIQPFLPSYYYRPFYPCIASFNQQIVHPFPFIDHSPGAYAYIAPQMWSVVSSNPATGGLVITPSSGSEQPRQVWPVSMHHNSLRQWHY